MVQTCLPTMPPGMSLRQNGTSRVLTIRKQSWQERESLPLTWPRNSIIITVLPLLSLPLLYPNSKSKAWYSNKPSLSHRRSIYRLFFFFFLFLALSPSFSSLSFPLFLSTPLPPLGWAGCPAATSSRVLSFSCSQLNQSFRKQSQSLIGAVSAGSLKAL